MLYYLFYAFHEQIGALNVFRYATFRSALAALSALVISLACGPMFIRMLRRRQIGQEIREEGPASHQAKKGTPTMGGLLILIAIAVPALAWVHPLNPLAWLALAAIILFGLIGFLDDWLKIAKKHNLGLTAKAKFGLQLLVGAGIGGALLALTENGLWDTHLQVPFLKTVTPDLGWLYVPFAMLVIVGSANAVNLTDGLDGLAIGSTLIASGTFAILTYCAGNSKVASYLGIANVRGADDLAVLCAAMVGASLGFLWFNCHPAEVFMGDVGSMALGGGLGTLAVLVKQELLLAVVGGLFVIEALSVIFQVASFKLRRVRIFRMAPIHHHFELGGWDETKVVIRFWIVALIFSLLSLATLKLR